MSAPRRSSSGVMGSPVLRLGRSWPSQRPAPALPLITLLSDFGRGDPFVGVLEGVIYGRQPRARLVDRCHGIRPHGVGGEVVVSVGRFGNLISNIDAEHVRERRATEVAIGEHVLPLRSSYGDAAPGERLALINAFDSVEIAQRNGDAERRLGLAPGAKVRPL